MFQRHTHTRDSPYLLKFFTQFSSLFFLCVQRDKATKETKMREREKERDSSKQFQALGSVCVSNERSERKRS